MAIKLTDNAARRLQQFLEQRDDGAALRFGVTKSGCSGFAYTMDFTTAVEEGDTVFQDHGIQLVVDRETLTYLDGMEVDFVKEGLNQTFKFNNPNVTATCGCGESFAV